MNLIRIYLSSSKWILNTLKLYKNFTFSTWNINMTHNFSQGTLQMDIDELHHLSNALKL